MYPVSRLPRRHNTHRISKRKAPCLLRPRGLDHFHVFGRWSRRLLLCLRRLRQNRLERRYLRWRKAPHHHHRLSEVRNDPERSDSDRRAQVVVPMLSSRDESKPSGEPESCNVPARPRHDPATLDHRLPPPLASSVSRAPAPSPTVIALPRHAASGST